MNNHIHSGEKVLSTKPDRYNLSVFACSRSPQEIKDLVKKNNGKKRIGGCAGTRQDLKESIEANKKEYKLVIYDRENDVYVEEDELLVFCSDSIFAKLRYDLMVSTCSREGESEKYYLMKFACGCLCPLPLNGFENDKSINKFFVPCEQHESLKKAN